MIKCKEDLINTYIENDHGELRDLYIKKAIELGFSHQGYRDRDLNWYNLDFIGICEGWDNDMLGQTMSEGEKIDDYECKKLTLSDLKPRTRTEYEKVTESIFDLRDEFGRGELYFDRDRCTGGIYVSSDQYQKIRDMNDFSQAALNNIYRKVEKEIDWRDDICEWQHTKKIGIYTPLDFTVAHLISAHPDKFLELCRVALRANGEIE